MFRSRKIRRRSRKPGLRRLSKQQAPSSSFWRATCRYCPTISHRSCQGGASIFITASFPVSREQNHITRHIRSEEHTSELQSLMRISYAVFCLKKKKITRSLNSESIQALKHNHI